MPSTHENGSGDSRLDRLEGLMALLIEDHVQFREEHKNLLTAQVVLTDRLDRLIQENAEAGKQTDQRLNALAKAGIHTDERLNALVTIVDGIIRMRPPQ